MLKDQTWIASATPDRLVVRHRAGRLASFLSFFFGSVFLAVAIGETGGMRWAAAALALLNYALAVTRSSLVTISFDRMTKEVECLEQRLVSRKSATLPLDEFTGAESLRAAGKRVRTRLGLATRKGVFIPIEQSFAAGERADIARSIDDWLGVEEPKPASRNA